MIAALVLAIASLPNATTTPGAVNPAVTQANIQTTICRPGYTKLIRPPAAYTNALKRKQLPHGARMGDYEEDHLIPLELGGHPRDPHNLWPEPWTGAANAHVKDRCENRLHRQVCSGAITLKAAQTGIATNWIDYCRGK